ncbi:anillin, actin binding protein 2 isoform X4 [Myripristis murdjan]|uniref:anillin, actin binding protein 2 isoform X4 n=1 Tax=Myripristis murdjan TaxID=586833 RepID=UPI001175DDFE|nr:anillin-like isoform X4 [Myripristis murdjan]
MEPEQHVAPLKRQRVPLSDSEDNILTPAETNEGQKRRRLETDGQENCSPKPSCSGRSAELEVKPDTPAIPSVRSRVQQLTQRQEGGAAVAQRCLSDPGADSPAVITQDRAFREHLLSEDEFSQRVARFNLPISQPFPVEPSSSCPRSSSNLVCDIQQKLQGSVTPSSKQASRIRQEREQELQLLYSHPIRENPWLKRSTSDPSLTEQGRTSLGSSPSSWISPRSRRRVRWPPLQPWDQVDGGDEIRHGNLTENAASGAETQETNMTSEKASCDSTAPATPLELQSSNEGQLQTEPQQPGAPCGQREEPASSPPESVSKDPAVSIVFEERGSESFSIEEEAECSSYGEEAIEPSTDEELRLWRYPQEKREDREPDVAEDGCTKERRGWDSPETETGDFDLPRESVDVEDRHAATEVEADAVQGPQGNTDRPEHENQTQEVHKVESRGSLRKVTFILEPELITDPTPSETNTSLESRGETSLSEAELSSHEETNTADMIDQMFGEVLEYAGRMEEDREDDEDHDSGIGTCSGDKDKMHTESEKERSEEEEEGCTESKTLETSSDDLTFPPSGILSPLSKSVEAVVTPLRLTGSQQSNSSSPFLTPEETTTTLPPESAPLYSIDAYRTQRQNKPPTIQSVTPGIQRRAVEKNCPQLSVNIKDKIAALNEEAGKLQTVINQTLQALSCCTDEEHGQGSLEEAEAEKLLLVSCEKRSALLAEVARLRDDRSLESDEATGELISQQPCRGTVSISHVQLPLKVEFVCSSRNRTGRPSHYFFVLFRYGPCNIVATPLATAADAQNGDTISFPTSITLTDIRSNFEIDIEVYSLSHTSVSSCSVDRTATKSRVTPRKLLNTITKSNNRMTSAAMPTLNPRRSSNFCLVGSHKLTLASLGQKKFPLDKVPFLSPLEGNIYLRLDSESHSNVQHQGFLTMFEVISGFGVWHRRYFVLEGYRMFWWNHPNDRESKAAECSISLSSSTSQCVKPVKRDSCARPFTFELVSNVQLQQQSNSQDALTKCWFSADTKQERLDWMEKLNQALLDLHTWSRKPEDRQQTETCSGAKMRESIL